MFKKTLLALAIAGTAFNAAATLTLDAGGAGAVATNDLLISSEGSTNTTAVDITAVTATISGTVTDYASSDKLRVTITGGTLTPATDLAVAYKAVAGTGADVANLSTAGTVTYPSTTVALLDIAAADEVQTQKIAATDFFTITGLTIAPTSIASGSTISYKVEVLSSVGGAVVDTVTGVVGTYKNQFSATIATTSDFGTNAIDVGDDRLTWAGGDKTDAVLVTTAEAAVDIHDATLTASTVQSVLTGSFTFLDTDADGKVETGSITTTTGSPVINTALTTVTEVAAGVGAETFTVTLDGKTQTLAPQTFSVTTELDYVDVGGKTNTYSKTNAGGAWALNGSTSYIAYLPFSNDFTRQVTVTNTGTVAGAITVDWTSAGTKASTPLTAVAAANSVTNITDELNALAVANGITGNAALSVVVNSPNANVRVSALYYSKTDQDRGIVPVEN